MERIVHFDLKGAPPKPLYFEQVLHCIKSWGATGVLLEWEDTFPYSANLAHLGSLNNAGGDELYSLQEVQKIIAVCKEIGLEVIQLVQTIGHMEFVLKYPCHIYLREYPKVPSILCPGKQDSKDLVKLMITQLLDAQPDAKYFHIGADEVSHLGLCKDCNKKMAGDYPAVQWRIYLDYIQELVLFIREQRPGITILMWDDILRTITQNVLQEYPTILEVVQPVVWNYEPQEQFKFPSYMWGIYKECFPKVWAGSAFKGANGSNQLLSPVKRYVSNQEGWLAEINRMRSQIEFVGVVITGWSRYDHFATLCELLPTSLPSLANCLKCYSGPVANFADLYADYALPDDQWPGKSLLHVVRKVAAMRQAYFRVTCGDMRATWMNSWQISMGFLNMFQVDNIDNYVYSLLLDLKQQETAASKELSVWYGMRTCCEWVSTHYKVMEKGLVDTRRVIQEIRRNSVHLPMMRLLVPWKCSHGNSRAQHRAAAVEDQAPKVEVQAPTVEDLAPTVEDQDQMLEDQAPTAEDHAPTDKDQAPMVEDQAPMIEDQAPMVEDQAPTAEDQASTAEKQASTVDNQAPTVEHQAPMVEDQGSMVKGHAPTVEDQVPTLKDRAPMVEDAPSTVAQVSAMISGSASTVKDSSSADADASAMVTDSAPMVEDAPSTDAAGSAMVAEATPMVIDATSTVGDAPTTDELAGD